MELSLGPEPAIFSLKPHSWSQNFMKLRFLMSRHRKNSIRGKVIGKKQIYLSTTRAWGLSGFIGEGNFMG